LIVRAMLARPTKARHDRRLHRRFWPTGGAHAAAGISAWLDGDGSGESCARSNSGAFRNYIGTVIKAFRPDAGWAAPVVILPVDPRGGIAAAN
jgi:hypothetical protein